VFLFFFLEDLLSMNNSKPPSRYRSKSYSLQVLTGGLQPKGLLSQPGGPGMDKYISKSPTVSN
jgi:hypothetical protein